MVTSPTARRLALAAGAAALVGMGTLSACGTKDKPAEVTPSPSPSATAPVTPTDKVLTPGPHAGSAPENSFAPTVKAPPPRTALPGNVITGG